MNFDIDLGKIGLTTAGAWDSSTTYERLTVVTYNGSAYVSRRTTVGVPPGTNDNHWQLIAVASSDGSGSTVYSGIELKYSSVEAATDPSTDPSSYWHTRGVVGDIYMAIRTKNGSTWSEWSVLRVKGADGKDGKDGADGKDGTDGQDGTSGTDGLAANASFTCIVFKRSDEDSVAAPEGGSYTNPKPSGWSDGIPEGTGKVWMSSRIFSSDGAWPQQAAWKTPVVAIDTGKMDYEWSLLDSPSLPTKSSPDAEETSAGWYDEINDIPAGSVANIKWRAERPIENGAYAAGSSWKMIYVKGEKGTNGTSIHVKGTFDNPSQLPSSATEGDAYIYNGTTTTISGKTWNAGHLYIWDGSDSWIDVGNVQGGYLHVKYSWDGSHFSGTTRGSYGDGETPADYIGILVDGNADDPEVPADTSSSAYATLFNKFSWCAWKGADGFGYEYIFKLASTAPAVPTPDAGTAVGGKYPADDDFVPEGWSDDPVTPIAEVQNCWICYRKKIDGVWSEFRGSAADSTVAALFSRYAKDGRGVASVDHFYAISDQASGVTVASLSGDWDENPDTLPVPTEALPYLWAYDKYTYTEGNPETTTPYIIQKYGKNITLYTVYYILRGENDSAPTASTEGWSQTFPTPTSALPIVYQKVHIEYTEGDPSDFISIIHRFNSVDYLKNIFGEANVQNLNGALLNNFVGVKNVSDNKVVAMLNGSNIGINGTHGKLLIAGGMDGLTGTGPDQATFKVYEDGHFEATDGSIGPFTVESNMFNALLETGDGDGIITLDENGIKCQYNENGTTYGAVSMNLVNPADGHASLEVYARNDGTYDGVALNVVGKSEIEGDILMKGSSDITFIQDGGINLAGTSAISLSENSSIILNGQAEIRRLKVPASFVAPNTAMRTLTVDDSIVYCAGQVCTFVLPDSCPVGTTFKIITHGSDTAVCLLRALNIIYMIGGGSQSRARSGELVSLAPNYCYTATLLPGYLDDPINSTPDTAASLSQGSVWVVTKA